MKRIILLLLLTLTPQGGGLAWAAETVQEQLQKALFEEEANHNLDGAIAKYKGILQQLDDQRKISAVATFRLGECFRKLGKTNEAGFYYLRVLQRFQDQTNLVKLSREHLPAAAAPGVGGEKAPAEEIRLLADELRNAEAEQAKMAELLSKLRKLPQAELRQALPANFKDEALDRLSQELAAARQAQTDLLAKYTEEHPKVRENRARIEALDAQVQARLEGVLAGLEVMVNSRKAAAENLASRLRSYGDQGKALEDAGLAAGAMPGLGRSARDTQHLQSLHSELKKKSRSELRQVLPTAYRDELLERLLADQAKTEQQLAAQRADYSDEHPEVKKSLELLKHINRQIEERISGIMAGLEILVASAKAEAEAVKKSDTTQGRPQLASVMLEPSPAEQETQQILRLTKLAQDSPDLLNAPASENLSPLMKAVGANQFEVVKYLLDHGASVNLKLRDTALHKAVLLGNKEMAEFLLQRGADPNIPDASQSTPLHLAARAGHKALCELLLKSKANPNARGENYGGQEFNIQNYHWNSTPLHIAVRRGFKAVAETLLDHGADIEAANSGGATPLLVAIIGGRPELAKFLVGRKANLKTRDNLKQFPLQLAVSQGESLVKLLLELGADVNQADSAGGDTALHTAILQNNIGVLRLLLAAKPNLEARNAAGFAPLTLAVNLESLAVARLLLEAGAAVNSPERSLDGGTALHLAAARANPEMATLLLGFNAKPNACDSRSRTPLAWAMGEGAPPESKTRDTVEQAMQCAEVLLANGADPNAFFQTDNPTGLSPNKGNDAPIRATCLHLAQSHTAPGWVKLLASRKASINIKDSLNRTPLHWAAHHRFLTGVRFLVENNAEVDSVSEDGSTPLLNAMRTGDPDCARYLIANGAKVNTRNKRGQTALHLAAGLDNGWGLVTLLLDNKADVRIADELGYTPLHEAAAAVGASNQPEIIAALIEAGAEVNARTKDDRTPLDMVGPLSRRASDMLRSKGAVPGKKRI